MPKDSAPAEAGHDWRRRQEARTTSRGEETREGRREVRRDGCGDVAAGAISAEAVRTPTGRYGVVPVGGAVGNNVRVLLRRRRREKNIVVLAWRANACRFGWMFANFQPVCG